MQLYNILLFIAQKFACLRGKGKSFCICAVHQPLFLCSSPVLPCVFCSLGSQPSVSLQVSEPKPLRHGNFRGTISWYGRSWLSSSSTWNGPSFWIDVFYNRMIKRNRGQGFGGYLHPFEANGWRFWVDDDSGAFCGQDCTWIIIYRGLQKQKGKKQKLLNIHRAIWWNATHIHLLLSRVWNRLRTRASIALKGIWNCNDIINMSPRGTIKRVIEWLLNMHSVVKMKKGNCSRELKAGHTDKAGSIYQGYQQDHVASKSQTEKPSWDGIGAENFCCWHNIHVSNSSK